MLGWTQVRVACAALCLCVRCASFVASAASMCIMRVFLCVDVHPCASRVAAMLVMIGELTGAVLLAELVERRRSRATQPHNAVAETVEGRAEGGSDAGV